MVAPLVLDERYRLVRQIRQTEDTALFLVRDIPQDALVALKVFLAPDENALKSYQKHLQVIQTLSHPHIARTLDSGTIEASSQFLFGGGRGTHLYLATEYIVGPNFQTAFPPESLLNAAAYRSFITTARQVCEALDYVHRRSLVHLDIKPENILLVPAPDGCSYSARLIDFDLLQTVSTPLGVKVRGTLPLVSPEVLRDSLISEKADLYSLGATLYLVASGKHPFSASTDRGLMKRILWHPPAPLEKLAPQLPHAFCALVDDLLQKNPVKRPASAREVVERIDSILGAPPGDLAGARAREEPHPRRGEEAELVGRQSSLRALTTEIDNLGNGEASYRLVLLQGASGTDKGLLLTELARYAALKGIRVFRGDCALPAANPYEPLRAALEAIEAQAPLDQAVRARARKALLVLDGRTGELPAPSDAHEAEDLRTTFFARTAELFIAAAGGRTTVLMFENLDRADPALAACIGFLARVLHVRARRVAQGRAAARTVADLLCVATVETPPSQKPAPHLQRLFDAEYANVLPMDFLDLEATEELLRQSHGGRELAPDMVAAIHRATGGHPRYLLDVKELLAQTPPAQLRARIEALPAGMEAHVRALADAASPDELRIAASVGYAGGVLPLPLVVEALGIAPDAVRECCANSRILALREDRVELRWRPAAGVCIARVAGEAEALLLGLAGTFETHGMPAAAARFYAQAEHADAIRPALRYVDIAQRLLAWEGAQALCADVTARIDAYAPEFLAAHAAIESLAGNAAQAASILGRIERPDPAQLLALARCKAGIGQTQEAFAVLDGALAAPDRGADPAARRRIRLALAELHIAHGQHERAEALLAETADAPAAPPDLAAQAWHLLGRAHLARKNWPHALACFQKASQGFLDAQDAVRACRDQIAAGDTLVGRGDFGQALGTFRHALALAEEHNDPLREALAAQKIGVTHYRRGEHDDAREHLETSHMLWEDLGEERPRADALNNLGLVDRSTGNLAEAVRHFQDALAILSELGDDEGQAAVLNNLASVLDAHGRYRDALTQSFKALELRKKQRDPFGIALSYFRLGWIYRHLGDLDHARSFAQKSHDLRVEVSDKLGLAHALHLLGQIDFLQGRYGQSLIRLRQSMTRFQALGDRIGKVPLLLTTARLYIELGLLDGAAESLDQGESLADHHALAAHRAEARFIRALLKDAQGDLYAAEDLLRDAEQMLKDEPSKKSLAEILLLRAQVLLALANRSKSEDALERAYSLISEIDARDLSPAYFLLRARSTLADQPLAHDTAERLLARAIAEAQEISLRPLLARLHLEFAELCRARNAVEAGREHVARAEEILRQLEDGLPLRFQSSFVQSPLARRVRLEAERHAAAAATAPAAAPAADAEPAHLRERLRNLERLQEITQAINSELVVDKVLTRIIDAALELANAERGFLIVGAGKDQKFQVARNLLGEDLSDPAQEISQSIAREVLTTGRPLVTNDAVGDARLARFKSVRDLKLMSIACLPLPGREKTIGTLYLDNRSMKNAFRDEDLATLVTLCNQAAIALENARLLEDNSRTRRALEESNVRIAALNRRLADKLREKSVALKQAHTMLEDRFRFSNIIGKSKAMQEVFHVIQRVATTDLPVLIEGESGTGKELIANAIHFNSARRTQPIISENCGALTPTLLESELFGHERGAFTGAVKDKQGLFEIADRGTLFLDEVGDMDLDMQKKLLRVLEAGEIRRVGGKDVITVDVRVITATNHKLSSLVAAGRFREDLFWRLNVIRISVPPLRDRREDIPLLVEHFLKKIAEAQGEPPRQLSQEALRRLLAYHWPGNVRELQHFLERTHLLAHGGTIGSQDVVFEADQAAPPAAIAREHANLKQAKEEFTRWFLLRALAEHGGVVSRAAQHCGISRETLHRLLRKYRLEEEAE